MAFAMALSSVWKKPGGGVPDAVFLSSQQSGQDATAESYSSDNVQYIRCDDSSQGQLPSLNEGQRRSTGRRRSRVTRKWQEKKDKEFDMVILPSDGCYMSGSDSDDSDWSVGWFEPHPTDFTENEGEESFAVLVPSYRLPVPKFTMKEDKDAKTPAWAALLANMSLHTNSETQHQLELWLASLTC